MMKTYYTGGSLGDTYVIVCKLYSVAKEEAILCKHYTAWDTLKPAIREVYSLMPNIAVEFCGSEDPLGLTGQFLHHKLVGKRMTYLPEKDMYNLELECHPEFVLGSIERFGLPEKYETLQLESGANPRKIRHVDENMMREISDKSDLPLVIVGKDSTKCGQNRRKMIDLRGNTSIKEMINVIKNSVHFYGCLGLLSLVALSQRVYSTLYKPLYLKDKHAYESRIQPIAEWRKYVVQ